MIERMIAEGVALIDHRAHEPLMLSSFLGDQEKGRANAMTAQQIQSFARARAGGTVIEGEVQHELGTGKTPDQTQAPLQVMTERPSSFWVSTFCVSEDSSAEAKLKSALREDGR